MTTLTLSKWGNAQAVRLPKEMREQVGMVDGCRVEATVRDGAIVLRPVRDRVRVIQVPRLSDMFRGQSGEHRVEEDPFGSPVGGELI